MHVRSKVMKLVLVAVLGGATAIVSTGALAQQVDPPPGEVTPGVSLASTDQIIVKMRPGRQADAASLGRAAGVSVTSLRALDAQTTVIKLPAARSDAALNAVLQAMARTPGVEWVEPDVRMFVNEDLSGQQWDLRGPADDPFLYGIDLPDYSPKGGQVVAVVDTGYLPHVDLAGQYVEDSDGGVVGYDFVSDARIGNDGDGRDGDASDPGDWITSMETRRGFFRGCPDGASSWHGTHVAGTIAALADDSVNGNDGIVGINPASKILPVRVLGKCGGYTSDIVDGVRWSAGLPVDGASVNQNAAGVVNLSLGGPGACPATWQAAIDAVTAAGTVVVVAAGNSNSDAANYSPAGCSGVITVAATGQAGNRSYYSNYGSAVEIAAPGGDRIADDGDTILSTLNTGSTDPVEPGGAGDTYVKYQGTSMAAPHVTGVVSLMLDAQPGLSPAQVLQIITTQVTPFPSDSTCADECGAGLLNARAAVGAASTTSTSTTTEPPAPTTTEASADAPGAFAKISPNDGKNGIKRGVTLSWETSSGALQYLVCLEPTASPNGDCSDFSYGPYSGTSVRFVGLSSGTYEWDVQAVNDSGSTIASEKAWTFAVR